MMFLVLQEEEPQGELQEELQVVVKLIIQFGKLKIQLEFRKKSNNLTTVLLNSLDLFIEIMINALI